MADWNRNMRHSLRKLIVSLGKWETNFARFSNASNLAIVSMEAHHPRSNTTGPPDKLRVNSCGQLNLSNALTTAVRMGGTSALRCFQFALALMWLDAFWHVDSFGPMC